MYIERKKGTAVQFLRRGQPPHSLSVLRFAAYEYDVQSSLHHPIYSALDIK